MITARWLAIAISVTVPVAIANRPAPTAPAPSGVSACRGYSPVTLPAVVTI